MSRALPRYLLEHPEGVSALDAGRDALKLSGPDEGIRRVAEALLAREPGAIRGPDALWRLEATPDAPVIAVAGYATGPVPEWDFLLEIGGAHVLAGGAGRARGTLVRPGRSLSSLPSRAREAFRPLLHALETAPALSEALEAVGPFPTGANLVSYREDLVPRFLRRALPDALGSSEVIRIAPFLRRAGRISAGAGLVEAAAEFGVPCPEDPRARDAARATALLYAAARDADLLVAPAAIGEPFDFGGAAFGPERLAGIPDRPGIYRFLDREGRVLYVGKSENLRRRVGGYFARRSKRRSRFAEMMAEVHDLSFAETGSGIAALLAEDREIREKSPPYNVQRRVRRRRRARGDLALLLPSPDSREVEVLVLRGGVPVDRAIADRRARGMRNVRDVLRRAYFSGAEPDPAPEAEQILATWLRAESDCVNSVDLSEVAGINDAARRIRAALTDPDLFREKSFYR